MLKKSAHILILIPTTRATRLTKLQTNCPKRGKENFLKKAFPSPVPLSFQKPVYVVRTKLKIFNCFSDNISTIAGNHTSLLIQK